MGQIQRKKKINNDVLEYLIAIFFNYIENNEGIYQMKKNIVQGIINLLCPNGDNYNLIVKYFFEPNSTIINFTNFVQLEDVIPLITNYLNNKKNFKEATLFAFLYEFIKNKEIVDSSTLISILDELSEEKKDDFILNYCLKCENGSVGIKNKDLNKNKICQILLIYSGFCQKGKNENEKRYKTIFNIINLLKEENKEVYFEILNERTKILSPLLLCYFSNYLEKDFEKQKVNFLKFCTEDLFYTINNPFVFHFIYQYMLKIFIEEGKNENKEQKDYRYVFISEIFNNLERLKSKIKKKSKGKYYHNLVNTLILFSTFTKEKYTDKVKELFKRKQKDLEKILDICFKKSLCYLTVLFQDFFNNNKLLLEYVLDIIIFMDNSKELLEKYIITNGKNNEKKTIFYLLDCKSQGQSKIKFQKVHKKEKQYFSEHQKMQQENFCLLFLLKTKILSLSKQNVTQLMQIIQKDTDDFFNKKVAEGTFIRRVSRDSIAELKKNILVREKSIQELIDSFIEKEDIKFIEIKGEDFRDQNDASKKASEEKKLFVEHNENKNFESEIFNLTDFLLNPKKELMMTEFSLLFSDVFFENELFKKLKNAYLRVYKPIHKKALNFPSKQKNFSNGLDPPLFLKNYKSFFESDHFELTHSFFLKELPREKWGKYQKRIDLSEKKIINLKGYVKIACELIKIEYVVEGYIKISENYINFCNAEFEKSKDYKFCFCSSEEDIVNKKKNIYIFYKEIKVALLRRFLYGLRGVEIFLKNGKSYLFNLYSERDARNLIDYLKKKSNNLNLNIKIISDLVQHFTKEKFTEKWKKNEITTYKYLLYLNKFSSRSFSDINQYYVFPWILRKNDIVFKGLDFSFGNEKEKKIHEYERDMKYPISLQTEEKRKEAIQKYKAMKATSKKKCFISHLGTHYSTGGVISYYKFRQEPFLYAMIRLQGGSLDNPNRVFISIQHTEEIIDNMAESRELIPEFFSQIEFMLNLNCDYYGVTCHKEVVDDLVLCDEKIELNNLSHENEFGIYCYFIIAYRNLLNFYASANINLWIDYTFGVKQLTSESKSCNIFNKLTYQENFNAQKKIEKYKIKYSNDKKAIVKNLINKKNIILNFGQTPVRLFKVFHPHQIHEQITSHISKHLPENVKYFFCFDKGFAYLYKRMNKIHSKKQDKKSKEYKLFNLDNEKKNLDTEKENAFRKFVLIDDLDLVLQIDEKYPILRIHHFEDDKPNQFYELEDFGTCINSKDSMIYLGLRNGKILILEIVKEEVNDYYNCFECILKYSIFAHYDEVNYIEINTSLNIYVSGGSDGMIYVRKCYDNELLSQMKISKKYNIQNIKVSDHNLIYVLCENKFTKENRIFGFTLNGIRFKKSEKGTYRNLQLIKTGHILTLEKSGSNKWEICILLGGVLTKKKITVFQNTIPKNKDLDIAWFEYKIVNNIEFLFIKCYGEEKIETIQMRDIEDFKENVYI